MLHKQFREGNLPPHVHRKFEEDVRELDLVVGGCEQRVEYLTNELAASRKLATHN